MNRYQVAVDLIRTLDQHRLLCQVGRATSFDGYRVKEAHYWYGRASGSQRPIDRDRVAGYMQDMENESWT